ncbi:hypothetical protein PENNAL_c0217G03719, partial [Penicillium nalgiovense]
MSNSMRELRRTCTILRTGPVCNWR